MSIQFSQALAKKIVDGDCVRNVCSGFVRDIYAGTLPTNADTAINGTLLGTLTLNGGAATFETLPIWTVTIGGTVGGNVTINMGNAPMHAVVASVTDTGTTAAAVAAAINGTLIKFFSGHTATVVGSAISIKGPIGVGASINLQVATSTVTGTITAVVSNSGLPTTSGITAFNTCEFDQRAVQGTTSTNVTGAIITSSQTWSVTTPVASGVATYFRDRYSASDTGAGVTTFLRKQGTITITGSGGDMQLPSTSVSPATPISLTGDFMVVPST